MFTTKRFGIAFGFAVACGALQASPVSVHASQGVSRPRADLRSAVKTVSISGSKTSREAFEELAQRAGIRVVFHREFVNTTRHSLAIPETDVASALDLLSFQTGNFWMIHDPHTVIVATDNPTVRREVEPAFIKSIPIAGDPQRAAEVVATLRDVLSMRQVAVATRANALIVRDTADRVALAEQIVFFAKMDGKATPTSGAGTPSGTFMTPSDEGVRAERSKQLRLTNPSVSIRMNQTGRSTFEMLADVAGLRVVFHRQFVNTPPFVFAAEGDVTAALDLLCFQTQSFWQIHDPRTIIVGPDNPAARRQVEETIVKTIYLRNGTSRKDALEIVTALQTLLSLPQVLLSVETSAIVIRDTADKVALAGKIVASMHEGAPTSSAPIESGTFGNAGDFAARNARIRKELDMKSTGPISIQINQQGRARLFEALCATAGIQCAFHPQLLNSPGGFTFAVDGVDIFTALDLLALRTQTFWSAQDSRTIFVGPDNAAVRREVEKPITRTIKLEHITTEAGVSEVIVGLRTLVSTDTVKSNGSASVTITDAIEKVELAERIMATLDVPGRAPLDTK